MLFYTHLIIPWEQHDEQVSSLATRTPVLATCSSVRFLESFISQIWVDEPSSQHMFKF